MRSSSPEELARITREQLNAYAKLFREAGIRADRGLFRSISGEGEHEKRVAARGARKQVQAALALLSIIAFAE